MYAERRFVDAAVRCSSIQELDGVDIVAGAAADVEYLLHVAISLRLDEDL